MGRKYVATVVTGLELHGRRLECDLVFATVKAMQLLTHGVVVPKDGIFRRNDNVTAHGNLEATSHCGALYTADDRHTRLLHCVKGVNLSNPILHEIRIITDGIDVDASAE